MFQHLGCAECHVATWTTGPYATFPPLGGQTIHPYTDLLLHDMGRGLADGRPDFEPGGREWRTPPLWGIGLAQTVNPAAGFLHDGRARSLSEAILWHGGEAAGARHAFRQLAVWAQATHWSGSNAGNPPPSGPRHHPHPTVPHRGGGLSVVRPSALSLLLHAAVIGLVLWRRPPQPPPEIVAPTVELLADAGEPGPAAPPTAAGSPLPTSPPDPAVRRQAAKEVAKPRHRPAAARRLALTGRIQPSFRIEADGKVPDDSLHVVGGSEEDLLRDGAMATIREIGSFRPPPGGGIQLVVPVVFTLRGDG